MKHPKNPRTELRLSAWFAAHYGVISRSEARGFGLTSSEIDSRVRSGIWEVLYRGAYHLVGAPSGEFTQLRGAVVVGGSGAAVSHRSAAWLWGLGDPTAEPTISVPRNRVVRVAGLQVVRTLFPLEPVMRRGLPCTPVLRTIIDCAGVMTGAELDELVDRAVARRAVRLDTLWRAAEEADLRRHRGRLPLSERLAARGVAGSPHPSVLESRMGRLFQQHRLPQPRAEVVWGPQRRYRLDFAYPNLRLAIEVDGWSAHFAPEQQRYDNRRANALGRAGWTVLHYDWWEVTYAPERVAAEIAETYHRLAAVA